MLKGEKVIIRDKKHSDSENDYSWRRNSTLTALDAAPPLKLSRREYIAYSNEEIRNPSRKRRRFAIDSLDGKHIGNCMFYDIDDNKKRAELGILIGDKEYWDDGYGTDAVNLLVQHIFNITNLERIYLKTLEWNIRAQKCFQKCGFVDCGRITRNENEFIVMELYREGCKPAEKNSTEINQTSISSAT